MLMYLCEETKFIPAMDEQTNLAFREPFQPTTPDWGSDPMEILMAKQEAERAALLASMI